MNGDLIKNDDIEKIVTEGILIYQSIKDTYEPSQNGKFLAIDIGSKDAYVSDTSADAVRQAKEAHPGNIFYVIKVGTDATETISHLFPKK